MVGKKCARCGDNLDFLFDWKGKQLCLACYGKVKQGKEERTEVELLENILKVNREQQSSIRNIEIIVLILFILFIINLIVLIFM